MVPSIPDKTSPQSPVPSRSGRSQVMLPAQASGSIAWLQHERLRGRLRETSAKLERHNDRSILFGKFFVKLLATFTSKSRKHNFRKACLCLLQLVAFHSQSRLFPSLFRPATSNLKQKARTGTENVKKKRSDEGIQGKLHRADFVTSRPSLPLCSLYCQRELAESKATKHSLYRMIFQTRARNVISGFSTQLHKLRSLRRSFLHFQKRHCYYPLSFPMNHRKFSSIFFRDCF